MVMALSGQVGRIYENGHFYAMAAQRAEQLGREIVERTRAEEESRHRARLSSLSAAVGLSLADGDSLGHGLQQCAHALVTHVDAALACIWTLAEPGAALELQASAGPAHPWNGLPGDICPGEPGIGRIASDGQPLLTNAVLGDPVVSDQDWARREGIVACAGHPLIVDDRIVGVMAVFARQVLSDPILSALASVADHIALGIERHRSTEALRVAEERMRFALEAAGVGIWDLDYATGSLRWSETMETQYGLQPAGFRGTFDAFVERIHPDDRKTVIETFHKAQQDGADFALHHRTICPDGTVRWLTGAGRVHLSRRGEPVRALGVSLDVTARHTLEMQYLQAQKMEALGRLASGVAHDFNNLLTAILVYCDLLLEDLAPDHPCRADVSEIQKTGASASRLTRQLLAFSRRQIVEPTRLDLNAVVTDMRAMLGRVIGEDVKVTLRLLPDLASARADRGHVEQIVLNLAVNARDAMPTGGTLTIETANVELDQAYAATHSSVSPGAFVALMVTDTGTGMTPQAQAHLFEPFFTTKELGKGTGLGLATVYGIVMQSGGSIDVHSVAGAGTSFTVYFPEAGVAERAVAPAPPASRRRTSVPTILVVEDADGLADLTRRLLQRQGYAALVAANAEEALRLFDRNAPIDILLTDVVMPGGSGPDLTRRLTARQPGLKVIYMSGHAEEAIAQHGMLDPGIAFLHKPFTADTLGRKIREVLDR